MAGGAAVAGAQPGARVDVVVSAERQDGVGRTFVALENVELLGLRAAAGGEGAAEPARPAAPRGALATLRVTARQAVYLTAATNFAARGAPAGAPARGPQARRALSGGGGVDSNGGWVRWRHMRAVHPHGAR